MKTMNIDLWAGQLRGFCANQATHVGALRLPSVGFDVRSYFLQTYSRFADTCRAVDEPGVALIAVDELTAAPAGMVCVRARVDRPVCATMGRHDRCDLYVPGREQLALRQLAMAVSPVRGWRAGSSDVSFRLFDLRTAGGMLDEQGRELRGLRSEGPTFVRCGGYLVFALPLGDATDWPASPEDAWACVPERVYFDERVGRGSGSHLARPPMRDRGITAVVRLSGPSEIGASGVANDEVAGELLVHGPAGRTVIPIGQQALRDGVLLGRYARCDGAGVASDESISRVHLLVASVDDRVVAIDTASTNGTRVLGGSDVRITELAANVTLQLGFGTRVRWIARS